MVTQTATLALGASVHSGWSAVVVVSGTLQDPAIEVRRRIELIPSTDERFVHPYHVAATMDIAAARKFVGDVALKAQKLALASLQEVASDSLMICAIVSPKTERDADLEVTLRSHSMIHAAEGRLFRNAIADAAARLGLNLYRFPENALIETTATAWKCTARDVETQLALLGHTAGSPWRRDQKLATLAAFLALKQQHA